MEWWVTPGPGGVVGLTWTWWSGGPHLDLVEWLATPGLGGVVGHTWTCLESGYLNICCCCYVYIK